MLNFSSLRDFNTSLAEKADRNVTDVSRIMGVLVRELQGNDKATADFARMVREAKLGDAQAPDQVDPDNQQ